MSTFRSCFMLVIGFIVGGWLMMQPAQVQAYQTCGCGTPTLECGGGEVLCWGPCGANYCATEDYCAACGDTCDGGCTGETRWYDCVAPSECGGSVEDPTYQFNGWIQDSSTGDYWVPSSEGLSCGVSGNVGVSCSTAGCSVTDWNCSPPPHFDAEAYEGSTQVTLSAVPPGYGCGHWEVVNRQVTPPQLIDNGNGCTAEFDQVDNDFARTVIFTIKPETPPSCQLTNFSSTIVEVDQPISFDYNVDPGTNAFSSADVISTLSNTRDWSIATGLSNGSGTRSISFDTPGEYFVACQAYTSGGANPSGQCTGNPWCEWDDNPPEIRGDISCEGSWANCDEFELDYELITVTEPPSTGELVVNVYEANSDTDCPETAHPDAAGFSSTLNVNGPQVISPITNFNRTWSNSNLVAGNYDVRMTDLSANWRLASGCSDPMGYYTVSSGGLTTVDFSVVNEPPSWWQTIGGDLRANAFTAVARPAGEFLSRFIQSFTNSSGVAIGQDVDALGEGQPQGFAEGSDYGAETSVAVEDYTYFQSLLGFDVTNSPDYTPSNNSHSPNSPPNDPNRLIYTADNDLIIDAPWEVASGVKNIIVVGHDLIIEDEIRVPNNSFLMFIVGGEISNGGIQFDPSLGYDSSEYGNENPLVEGIFVAEGDIEFRSSDRKFVGEGMFVSSGGNVFMRRNLGVGNQSEPGVLLHYGSRFLHTMPDELREVSTLWEEVAP